MIRAVGDKIVVVRVAEEIKSVGLFIPDAYKYISLLWGRVKSMGAVARRELPIVEIGDLVMFKCEDALTHLSREDVDVLVVHAGDCLLWEMDAYRRPRSGRDSE